VASVALTSSTEVLSTIVSANQGTDVDLVSGDGTNTSDSKGYNLIGTATPQQPSTRQETR